MRNQDAFAGEMKQLTRAFFFIKTDTPTGSPPADYSKLWLPTPETSNGFSQADTVVKRIF